MSSDNHTSFFTDLVDATSDLEDSDYDGYQISDEKELEKGLENVRIKRVKLSNEQEELSVHDFNFPVMDKLVDPETGLLTSFGTEFIEDFNGISQDTKCLFTYFSGFKNASIQEANDQEMNPFVLYKFLSELYESQCSVGTLLGIDTKPYTQFVVKVLLNSKQLMNKMNNYQMLKEIKEIASTIPELESDVFQSIIDESICSALNSSFVKPVSTPEKKVYERFEISKKQRKSLNDMRKTTNNYISLNTFVHYRYHHMRKIMQGHATEEQINESLNRSQVFSQKIGQMMSNGKLPLGNIHLIFTTKWEPKFINTRLSRSAFFEISYGKTYCIIDLKSNMAEVVIPYFEKEPKISVKMSYVTEKFDGTKSYDAKVEQKGKLAEITIENVSDDTTITQKLKKSSSLIPTSCGILNVDVKFVKKGMADIQSIELSSASTRVREIAESIAFNILDDWASPNRKITLLPPQELYTALCEVCIRYSIPAAPIIAMLFEVFFSFWNESESYLCAITSLYMVTKYTLAMCETDDDTKQNFAEMEDEMRVKVKNSLATRFRYPCKYEKACFMQLLILMSFLANDNDDLLSIIQGLIENAKGTILGFIFKKLVPVEITKPTKQEHIDLYEYMKKVCPSLKLTPPNNYEFTVEGIAIAAELISSFHTQTKTFYQNNIVPDDLKVAQGFDEIFKDLAKLLIKVFESLNPDPSDKHLFKFYFGYRKLWEEFKMGKEFSPFKLFFSILLVWLSTISEKLCTWTKRAVDSDKFEVYNERDMTSTSLSDLILIFSDSFNFVKNLKWKDKNIVDIIEAYLSTCTSCLKYYTELLTMLILSYFPNDVILQSEDQKMLSDLAKEGELVYKNIVITPDQIYVIINDFCNIQPSWADFIMNVQPLMGATKIPEQFLNPIPWTAQLIENIPKLFSCLVSEEIFNYISSRLWVDNKNIKLIFSRKASKRILNPEFTTRTSAFYSDLYDSTIEFINSRASSLRDHIHSSKLDIMLEGFIRGLDTGLMNVLIDEEPIKHKRLIAIIEFIKDIQAEMFDIVRDEHDIRPDMYKDWAWRSKLATDNIRRDPAEILAIARNQKDQKGLLFFILARSFTNDKECTKWANENQARFICSRFSPLF